MSPLETVRQTLRAKQYRKDNRTTEFECEIEADIYPGVELDVFVICAINRDNGIEDQELAVKDKNGKWCDWDWDDLTPYIQNGINSKIIRAFKDWRMRA